MTDLEIDRFEKTTEYVRITDGDHEWEVQRVYLSAALRGLNGSTSQHPYSPLNQSERGVMRILTEIGVATEIGDMFRGTTSGWVIDDRDQWKSLYDQAVERDHTYHVRLQRGFYSRYDTRHDAIGMHAILSRRNPDATVSIEVEVRER